MNQADRVRVADLFCGCGGLSLGFDLYDGSVKFQVVLAIDNDPAALRVFNQNLAQRNQAIATGRLADLTWFAHRSEALLYYLAHYAVWLPDAHLSASLESLGFADFLHDLRQVDDTYSTTIVKLCHQSDYQTAIHSIDNTVWGLAILKSVGGKLGVSSLRTSLPNCEQLPWTFEYKKVTSGRRKQNTVPSPIILKGTRELWDAQMERLTGAVTKVGKGQHATVASKVGGVVDLLVGAAGRQLRDTWVAWRATRDSLRAAFCLSVERRLDELYHADRKVGLLLGGPPCKGWSRIGRAVIENLREQGVHAWASHDYGDERNALLHNYVLFLDALRPAAFLFENVAHFESSLRTPAGNVNAASELQRAISSLGVSDVQYEVASQIVSARSYGIPQDRDRYIMVGARTNRGSRNLEKTFFGGLKKYDTEVPLNAALRGLEDPGVFAHEQTDSCRSSHLSAAYATACRGLPAAESAFVNWVRQPGFGQADAPRATDAHIVRAPRPDDARLFRFMAPGLRWMDYKFKQLPIVESLRELIELVERYQRRTHSKDLPSSSALKSMVDKLDESLLLRLLLEGLSSAVGPSDHHLLSGGYLAKGLDRHGDWLERLSPDRPCKTVVAHIGKDTYGYVHPTQPRALSMREAARVQTFPDFFRFGAAGVVDGYSMIGNAVPPMLANQFARRLAALRDETGLFDSTTLPERAISDTSNERHQVLAAAE